MASHRTDSRDHRPRRTRQSSFLDKDDRFEAVAYGRNQEDISGESLGLGFRDTGTSDENPTQHTYTMRGDFMVTATASYGPAKRRPIICRACASSREWSLLRVNCPISAWRHSSRVSMRYILLLMTTAEYTNAR